AYGPTEKQLTLTGQINPTEHGQANVTAPLQGIVIQPLVKVGQHVGQGESLAEINNVYGQTSMQLTQKLDADRAAVVSAQNALQQAISSLGQARSTLATARTTLAQARDNLVAGKAELQNATTDFHRKQRLFTDGVSAQADVDDARERYLKAQAVVQDMLTEVKTAEESVKIDERNIAPGEENVRLCHDNVALAQRQVDHDQVIMQGALNPVGSAATQFYIRSPISGIVTAVNMSPGLAVSPGTVLASVVDTTRVYVDANAYAADLQGVHVGDPLTVKADGFPDETFSGTVSTVGEQVDPNTRTVAVRCLIANQHNALRPGLFVQALLKPQSARQALLVPNQAVLIDGKRHYVVIATGPDKFEKRTIREGVRTDTHTEVLEGLKPGEKVVTQGNILVVQQ
ncbi:MAG: efflux RND transporter periplasmic adaptor subunit, partial [Candidatus Xenobia bacterium]